MGSRSKSRVFAKEYRPHVYITRLTGELKAASSIGLGNNGPAKNPHLYTSVGLWYGFNKFVVAFRNKAWVVTKKNGEHVKTISLTNDEVAILVARKLNPPPNNDGFFVFNGVFNGMTPERSFEKV